MKGKIATVVALGALLIAMQMPGAEAAKKAKPAYIVLTTEVGQDVSVPPLEVIEVKVFCPRNFAAVSAGTLNGATDVVYAVVDPSHSHAAFAFGNPSSVQSFDATGQVTCVAGAGSARIRTASVSVNKRKAVEEAKARYARGADE